MFNGFDISIQYGDHELMEYKMQKLHPTSTKALID